MRIHFAENKEIAPVKRLVIEYDVRHSTSSLRGEVEKNTPARHVTAMRMGIRWK